MRRFLNLHTLFEIGIDLKGIHAVIELLGAGALYFYGNHALLFLTRITESEHAEDPADIIMGLFFHQAHHALSEARGFIVLYLLISAIVNLMIVIGLHTKNLRVFPISIIVLSLFVLYQVHRVTVTHSAWLAAFTVFDIFVIYLIHTEYTRRRTHAARSPAPSVAEVQ